MTQTQTEKYVQVSDTYMRKKIEEADEAFLKSLTGSRSHKHNQIRRLIRISNTIGFALNKLG